jgi:UDP-N-acetylmuramoyl-tripeptide--D-alanyl-D-alanine ligase
VKLSTLAALLRGQLIGPDLSYTSVNIDSRLIEPGALFVAIIGERFDGHDFITQAAERGAVAALVEKRISTQLPLILVPNTRKALEKLAENYRKKFAIPIIGLTGSCGKTTTKEMIRAILSEIGPVLASEKSFNNDIGVPLTLLKLTKQYRFAVIEMGANHLGEIACLTHITKPDIALITNIGPAHLEGFGSIENVAKAKSEIFLGLPAPPHGIAVINADDSFAKSLQDLLAQHTVICFGISKHADFSAHDVQLDDKGNAQFSLVTPKGQIAIHLPLPGKHNVSNALAAAAVASQVGASLNQIKTGLEKMPGILGRLTLLKSKTGAAILDDTYNANPNSVAAALQLLIHYPGRHFFVMGDMSELGDNATYYHRQIGQLAKELGIEHVYTCGKLTGLTAKTFGLGGEHFTNQEDLVNALKPELQKDVVVLIKGSRRSQMEKVVEALVQ